MKALKYFKTNKKKVNCIFYVHAFLVFSISIVFTGCSEWLTVEPEGDLVEEEFWTKTEDIESVLAATYSAFGDAVVPSLIFGELRADCAALTGTEFADYQRIAEVEIKSTNNAIKWGPYYNIINLANTVLFYSPRIQEVDQTYTDELRNGIEAEAVFLRSLSYFYLVRLWKDVPLVLQPSVSDTVDLFPEKSTEYEVLDFLLKDLEKAKNKAFTTQLRHDPKNERRESFFRGRANKFAILALMADIYLWNEQYEKCIEACDQVLSSGVYRILSEIEWFNLFHPGNAEESIFELQFDYTLDQNNKIHDNLVKTNSSAKFVFKGLEYFKSQSDIRMCKTRTPVWKYQGYSDFITKRLPEEKDANIIYYRLGDIYLMKAEALNELNRTSEANVLLQTLSERAGVSFQNITSQESMRLYILDERVREFAMEGKRWFDVLRYAKRNNFENKEYIINMVLENVDIKEKAILEPRLLDTMSYYLPIPENDILYNQNLEQNPYYNR